MAAENVHITVDGVGVDMPKGTLLWEAAKSADIDIPIFCYHSKLGPVGVCRMCMVEVEGMPKLTTACTTPVADGMVVYTRSPEVEKAQRGVLEFLLINHPLDCPICDRGGECPLQDQTFTYGPGISRFIERKRHFLKPVHLGPTIDLDRERCILCWRCVRFTSEITQDDQLILSDRGSETFIATYEGQPYVSNFSGNVIELCPVGALTSRAQRFTFRPWELRQHPSICPHCPLGCNIQIDVRDAQEVIRFRSRTNDAVDDGWLCDRGRFGYGFIGSAERLKTPLIRRDGKLVPASWQVAYRAAAEGLQEVAREHGNDAIAGLVSPRLPNEDLFAFKRFMNETLQASAIDYWPRPQYAVSNEQAGALARLDDRLGPVDALDRARLIVLIGADPSEREPVLELRIRKAVNKLGARLIEIGVKGIPLTEIAQASVRCNPDEMVGILRAVLLSGDVPDASPEFQSARSMLNEPGGPIVVLYDDSFEDMPPDTRPDVLTALDQLVESIGARAEVQVIPMLRTANEMAARDFGLMSLNPDGKLWGPPLVDRISDGEFRAAVVSGANPGPDVPGLMDALHGLRFLVVSELVLSETARLADVVLPAACFAERVGTFTNTSRRVQVFSEAVPAPGISRPDWQILVELSQRWDNSLPYASPEQILADISTRIPLYAGRMPASYRGLAPQGLSLAGGTGVAAE